MRLIHARAPRAAALTWTVVAVAGPAVAAATGADPAATAALATQAPAASPAPAESGRPRIGLVLAGGGAKGGAHVGVLKVLEELNVPIDCIAGTSMGALVAGGYASGIPAKDLEKFMLDIDWPKVVAAWASGRRNPSSRSAPA